jgi:hypothetical protein
VLGSRIAADGDGGGDRCEQRQDEGQGDGEKTHGWSATAAAGIDGMPNATRAPPQPQPDEWVTCSNSDCRSTAAKSAKGRRERLAGGPTHVGIDSERESPYEADTQLPFFPSIVQ